MICVTFGDFPQDPRCLSEFHWKYMFFFVFFRSKKISLKIEVFICFCVLVILWMNVNVIRSELVGMEVREKLNETYLRTHFSFLWFPMTIKHEKEYKNAKLDSFWEWNKSWNSVRFSFSPLPSVKSNKKNQLFIFLHIACVVIIIIF